KPLGGRLFKSQRPAIFLTLRYKTDDQFWFSFFHEAGHVLKHKQQTFLEVGAKTEQELEADKFASNVLIPPVAFRQLKALDSYTAANVEKFAAEIGVCSGIVVGRLHHEGLLPHSHLRRLIQRLGWANEH